MKEIDIETWSRKEHFQFFQRSDLPFYNVNFNVDITGLKEYAQFFVSDDLAGPEGPLAAYGLVSDPELAATQTAVDAEQTIAVSK